ncbi:hypothetical protein ScPMuIL_015740 [Solemya velum]
MIPVAVQNWLNHVNLPFTLNSIAQGLHGFEELKKYIKQGSEFCKDIASILQERAELENNYAKGLGRLAVKLNKTTNNGFGTLVNGWKAVGSAMEQEADLHKNLATALLEELHKPLKQLVEAQAKVRKPIEATVDKSLRNLTDRRLEENRAKKTCYNCAKEYEKLEESLGTGKGKQSDKDIAKMEKKSQHVLDALRKADKEYCDLCEKAEMSRQEWECQVTKGTSALQVLEEERINRLSEYLNQYNSHISVLGPRLTQSCDRLHEAVLSLDLHSDIQTIIKQKGTGQFQPEQILLDCYAEDPQFSMKSERRRKSLLHYLVFLKQSMERERKGREGVEKLVEVYKARPNFADQDAQEETRQKLKQVTYMMNFLEASHYKISSYVSTLDGQQKPSHKFATYMEQSRDKQGIPITTLKLPPNIALEYNNTMSAGGDFALDEAYDDDEFDDIDTQDMIIGRCRALYDYQARQTDELSIHTGEEIKVYNKQADGWWQGELNGRVGIFPATYVKDC